jgi:energy-coupling factor transporter ATP-binding protein EcfA2
MSAINELKIKNFKAFNEESVLKLGGKHLLLYGENGSGKSSIYWSLYTLLQSTTKSIDEIEKYFDKANNENLLNLSSTTDDSHIKISAFDEVDTFHKINRAGYTLEGTTTRAFSYLEALNNSSDFIAHRLLINFYNFRNSKEINLWEVFVRDIFPFITVAYRGRTYTLSQLHKEIKETLPYWSFNLTRRTFKVRQSNHHQRIAINNKINALNQALNTELAVINGLVNTFYADNFKEDYEENLEISLQYSTELLFGDIVQKEKRGVIDYFFHSKKHVKLNNPFIKLNIRNQKEDGSWQDILRPQSYFNEAKLTQIALSIRFALTEQRMGVFDGQFLALDDLLVSLDMSNRDKVLDIILGKFATKYKIYLFTHEKSFFDFCLYKIKQYNQKTKWNIQEIYEPPKKGKEPTIIDSDFSNYDKAEKYFNAKDYIATSLYLRKEFEKVVKERLPKEYTRTVDGEFHNLAHYWKLFREHYKGLSIDMDTISPKMNKDFEQSKAFVLNRQAHHNLSEPVYTIELKKIFTLIDELKRLFPIPETILLLRKGMQLKFSHPTVNYTIEFELLNDLRLDKIGSTSNLSIPRCRILTWQYNDTPFWSFITNQTVTLPKPIEHKLNAIRDNHTANVNVPLGITNDMFLSNSLVVNDLWSLKEILDKSNIVL